MAVVSSELFLYGVTLHHTVSGISSRFIDFLRMRAWRLRGRRGAVCGIGEYPRHVHEVTWDFGSAFCLASVHAYVYCRVREFYRKTLTGPQLRTIDTTVQPIFFGIIRGSNKWQNSMAGQILSIEPFDKGASRELHLPYCCHITISRLVSALRSVSFYGTILADGKEFK